MVSDEPKSIAKRVAALSDEALVLADDVFVELPKMYIDQFENGDCGPLGYAWVGACEAAERASERLSVLAHMLKAESGMVEVQ